MVRFVVLLGLVLLVPVGPSGAEDTESNSEAVQAEARLAESVKYLASDDLEGRGVGTRGLELAAEYIAREFSTLGLKTQVFEDSPFQKFAMTTDVQLGPAEQNTLQIVGPAVNGSGAPRISLKLGEDFQTLAIGGTAKLSAPLVFVGYGITAKENNYDDYAGVDVKGKIVVLVRKEPQQKDPQSPFDGTNASRHATFMSKIANAYEHGAAAVLLVNDRLGIQELAKQTEKRWKDGLAKLVEMQKSAPAEEAASADVLAKYRKEVTDLAEQVSVAGKQLAAGDFDRIVGFREAGSESSHRSLPVFFCRRQVLERVIQQACGVELDVLEKQIDEGLKPASRLLEGWQAEVESNLSFKESEVKNVVGVLEGVGPLADETIVIGAHYDHVGMGGNGNSLAPGTIAVHNGADDNASGTASLLEVARRFAARSEPPRRRLVFIAFTGEESGLFGSAHYVKQPRFPLEKTVAMVNMDMVGRLNDNKLIVHGTGSAKEFDGLIDELNKRHQFSITKEPSGYGPSDHQSFYEKQVPVIHLFTGTHSDYHRPSDDFERINVTGMRRIADLVTDLVGSLETAPARPEYLVTSRPSMRRGGDRPYLGTIPDFSHKIEGYALMGVATDSPAEKAGLKMGDIIIQLGESRIGGLPDIDNALRKHKPGESVKVVVQRGNEKVELTVVLGAPK